MLKEQITTQQETISHYQQLDWSLTETAQDQRNELVRVKEKFDAILKQNQDLKNQLSAIKPVLILANTFLAGSSETEKLKKALESATVSEFIGQKVNRIVSQVIPSLVPLKKAV
ncbi:MAG: hypothetical protein H7096_11275 [Flavobacterium sp.]|nr:hypothetical protein [Pedobacter sp.]